MRDLAPLNSRRRLFSDHSPIATCSLSLSLSLSLLLCVGLLASLTAGAIFSHNKNLIAHSFFLSLSPTSEERKKENWRSLPSYFNPFRTLTCVRMDKRAERGNRIYLEEALEWLIPFAASPRGDVCLSNAVYMPLACLKRDSTVCMWHKTLAMGVRVSLCVLFF